jgi:hypothetical protein
VHRTETAEILTTNLDDCSENLKKILSTIAAMIAANAFLSIRAPWWVTRAQGASLDWRKRTFSCALDLLAIIIDDQSHDYHHHDRLPRTLTLRPNECQQCAKVTAIRSPERRNIGVADVFFVATTGLAPRK